jgi:hypothetical protein
MNARLFLAALLVGGTVSAAGSGAYLAMRHNAAGTTAPPAQTLPAQSPAASDTEGQIESPDAAPPTESAAPAVTPPPVAPVPRPRKPARRDTVRNAVNQTPIAAPEPEPAAAPQAGPPPPAVTAAEPLPTPEVSYAPDPDPIVSEPLREEVVIPASAVIGLQVETTLSSEHSEVEDRVDARVTRDVLAEGRVAIPAGSRVIGHVTMVDRGGKVRERARLGVRFHTLVLAGGLQVPLRTETIVREGDSPGASSARKIGGAAAGGAILGAILGGGKGAAIGGAAGAGAGTAAVMAGDRRHATLPAGATLTARLSDPVVIELDRQGR